MSLNILHTIASLGLHLGGPTRSVISLCNSLGRRNIKVILLSADQTVESSQFLAADSKYVEQKFLSKRLFPFSNSCFPITCTSGVKSLHYGHQFQIIHDHGLWLPFNHYVSVASSKIRVPLVVSPRGMLEPWAINYRSWKKKIALRLWVYRDLQNATAFCTTANKEAENIRRLGFRQPIAVVPNGIDVKPLPKINANNLGTKRQALFLSRIHPVKGVCELVEAWSKVQPRGWELIIAGPNENNHAYVVQDCIKKHELHSSVRLAGTIKDEDKWLLYRNSDLFILPTYSENFGIVVAEALSMGIPVITTKGAPWQVLIEEKCGWWIDIGVEPLTRAIKEATSLDRDLLREMGSRGRRLAERSFSWDLIAEKMELFYLWLIGKNDKPDWVDV